MFAAGKQSGISGTPRLAGLKSEGTSCSSTRCVSIARGIVAPATICDHVEPHHGDVNKFWLGPFQSLCKQCHDSTKRFIETRGYRPDIGLDGLPLDLRHPVYSRGR